MDLSPSPLPVGQKTYTCPLLGHGSPGWLRGVSDRRHLCLNQLIVDMLSADEINLEFEIMGGRYHFITKGSRH